MMTFPRPPTHPRRRRRGFSAVIAMLFLVLFGTLAPGVYATASMSAAVSESDRRAIVASTAAESGMDFARYQLSRVRIPPGTPTSGAIDALYEDLQAQLVGSANLAGRGISRDGNVIRIPDSGYINLDPAGVARFRLTITDWAGEIVVKSEGAYGTADSSTPVARAISMDFTRTQRSGSIFDFAVASKGQIFVEKGHVTGATGVDPAIATMMSALGVGTSIQVSNGVIGGELTLLDTASISVTGGTVAGSSIPSVILSDHVNVVSEPPEFPLFDPLMYRHYATNTWVNNAKVQSNIRIPAGTGTPSKPVVFNANDTVQGILYIESPNNVRFNGNFKLQGLIVMETSSSTTDSLDFRGNVTHTPVPAGTQFDALRATSGVAILAPNANIAMSGSTDSNLRGSVVANKFEFQGSAKITIDQGSLITLSETSNTAVLSSAGSAKAAGVFFSGTGAENPPTTGVTFSTFYAPKPSTYQEVVP